MFRTLTRSAASVAALATFLAGCARLDPPAQRPGDDPFDQVHSAAHASASPANHRVRVLPSSAHRPLWFFRVRHPRPQPLPVRDRIHPTLREWIRTRPGTDIVELMVTFSDTVAIPRFPRPNLTRPRTDPYNENAADSAAVLIDILRARRASQYSKDSLDLAGRHRAQVLEKFWLIQAMLMAVPLAEVDSLSRHPDVVFVRPNLGDPPPHDDGNARNDPGAARKGIGSEHYSGLGMGHGWIALLDTGVRTTHQLLCAPSPVCLAANCVTGDCDGPYSSLACQGYTGACPPAAGGDMDTYGHGTSSAAILAGNSNLGDGLRGVTQAELDCFTIYGSDALVRVNAAVKGFEYAVARLNQVIVAEMQDNTATDIADVSAAADHAYLAGAVVIAANGNSSYWGSGEPARSRRVIGVGAYYLEGEVDVSGAWGLTSDGRIKPDLKAPSYTETASNLADDDTQYFGGTSGATPYAAGAASLMRNWMVVGLAGIDPGQVYAHLILSGDVNSPYDATSSQGAGKIRLPESGASWWGKTWVSSAVEHVEIPVEIAETAGVRVSASIWWPEAPVAVGGVPMDGHNDIDLQLRGPRGTKAYGESDYGVFERASWTGVATGSWRLRIKPVTMRSTPQIVYWGVSVLPAP